MKTLTAILFGVFFGAGAFADDDEVPEKYRTPEMGSDAQRANGKALYTKNCEQCHGEKGDGKGIAYKYLKPWPRDFTKGIYKFKSTIADRLPTTDDIAKVIKVGNPGTGMPPWPHFTDAELKDLAYYIKTFSEDFSDPEALEDPDVAPIPTEFPSAPSFSEDRAKRGQEVFKNNQCVDCHGITGRGGGSSAPEQTDMDGNHVQPRDLTKRWFFRNGSTRDDIFRTLTTGIAPMPNFESLSEDDRWALVDYVWSLGRSEAKNATVVVSKREEKLEFTPESFANAEPAYFPLYPQITQPGRAFYSSITGVEVRSIYNDNEIAFQLIWHDMSAQKKGSNSPDEEVVEEPGKKIPEGKHSDAIAIQIPSVRNSKDPQKPYFLYGDKDRAVDLWFVDLAQAPSRAQVYEAKGRVEMIKLNDEVGFSSVYEEGRWIAYFKRKRMDEEGESFVEGDFTPIAFSTWDGFLGERGNRRSLSGWYHVYLKPLDKSSIADKMANSFGIVLFLQLGIVFFARRRKE